MSPFIIGRRVGDHWEWGDGTRMSNVRWWSNKEPGESKTHRFIETQPWTKTLYAEVDRHNKLACQYLPGSDYGGCMPGYPCPQPCMPGYPCKEGTAPKSI